MKKFLVIENDKVINCINAESKEIAENVTGFMCIEYDEKNIVDIGWIYDEKNNLFINPNIEITN